MSSQHKLMQKLLSFSWVWFNPRPLSCVKDWVPH